MTEDERVYWGAWINEYVVYEMTDIREGPSTSYRHIYEGITYPNICLDSSIEGVKFLEVRPDDVFIITFPKSGTHWVAEIVGLIISDGYSEKVDRSLFSGSIEMIDMDEELPKTREEEEQNPPKLTPFIDIIRKAPSPRTILSHLRRDRFPPDMLKKAKVIYVARNPKDVTSSWFNMLSKKFIPTTWEENVLEFFEGRMSFGPWPEHIQEFWEIRGEQNLLFLFYEDILLDPVTNVKHIASHIGRPLSEKALQRVVENSSILAMKKTYQRESEKNDGSMATHQKFLAKGIAGGWKERFTVAQNETFDRWYQQQMAGTDIPVKFD
ncbi:sulfotransferase 1B1-like [Diadema antillarum]|uniref:sulfotransferase 1B1-like n=1 Tax=Diadema antillarum TaxID=105358 RepID=UPI003A8A13D0